MYQSVVLNLKKVIYSILPIISLVLILSFIFQIETNTVIRFLSSSIMVIFGLVLFTTGSEISLNIIGEEISKKLIKKKKLWLILLTCLFLGTFITILEPEFLTISQEARGIPLGILLFSVSLGIGIFLMLAIYRILKKIDFKYLLISGYLLIFLLLMISKFNVIPFAFDMSSVTAGTISAPFLLAFGGSFSNNSKSKKDKKNEFGILSICGIGPILMILLLGFIFKPDIVYDSDPILKRLDFLSTLWMNFYQVLMSLSPLGLLYFLFLKFDNKNKKTKNKKEIKKVLTGLTMVLVGITLFLTGGDVGYFKIGYMLGTNFHNINHLLIIIIGGVFGYFIAKIEPSLKVLINYVNDVTNGSIKDKFLERFLCIGVSLSVILSLLRVLNDVDVMYFLIPTYFLALFLAFFTPTNFLAIAFDSGGVVAGSITSSFLLPMLIGVASNIGINYLKEAFGVLSLISIIPVIILEIVGLIYQVEVNSYDTKNIDDSIIDYR